MSTDDTPSSEKLRHNSGEFPPWLDMLFSRTDRIEKGVAGIRAELAAHVGDDKVLTSDVETIKRRHEAEDADQRQMGIGTKLAIISAVASPLIVIVVESFKH